MTTNRIYFNTVSATRNIEMPAYAVDTYGVDTAHHLVGQAIARKNGGVVASSRPAGYASDRSSYDIEYLIATRGGRMIGQAIVRFETAK